jgi:hypothetical protein
MIQERNHPGRSCSCPRRRDDDDDDGGTGNRCTWCHCDRSTVTCPFWKGITTLLQMWMMILGIVVVVRLLLLHKNDSLVVVVVGASRTDSLASNRSCRNWPLEHHYHMDDDDGDDLHRSLTRKLVVARPVANCCCVGCQSPFHHHRCHDGSSCVGATMKCSRRHWTDPNHHRAVDRCDGPPTLEARALGNQ